MDKALKILRKNTEKALQMAGWTRADLARELKWPGSRVTEALGNKATHEGGTEPGLEKIQQIARVLGVKIEDLFSTDEAPSPHIMQLDALAAVEVVTRAIHEMERYRDILTMLKKDPDKAEAVRRTLGLEPSKKRS